MDSCFRLCEYNQWNAILLQVNLWWANRAEQAGVHDGSSPFKTHFAMSVHKCALKQALFNILCDSKYVE